MNNRINYYFAILALVTSSICVSCISQEPEGAFSSEKELVFSVYQSEPITKSSYEDVSSCLCPLDINVEDAAEIAVATNFRLMVTEQSLDDMMVPSNTAITRATPVFTENLGNFAATAYLPRTEAGAYSSPFLAEAEFVKDGTKWTHTYSDNLHWPENNGKVVFFMRYPASSASSGWTYGYKGGKNIISTASYTTPGAGTGATAAEQQTDIVFATTTLTEADMDGTNNVLFYHPFAGVKFKLGEMPEGLVVKSITLDNVIGSGSCEVTPYYGNVAEYDKTNSNRDGDTPTRSVDCVSWNTSSSARTSFTQSFTTVEQKTTPDASGFPSGFKDQGIDYPNHDQLNTPKLSKTFILIPQTFNAGNKLSIIIDFEYKGMTLSRTAEVSDVTWKAGSLYTYTIKFNSEIDVTITDTVSDNVKSNVVITNTGNVPEYIRAAIVGNWFDASGNIVSAWSEAQGTFAGKAASGSKWVKDGAWYYYTDPVAPGAETPGKLFTSYTAPAAPVTGAHLEMKIMVQAIIADDMVANSAWGVKPSELN